jgi:hypothetical protein
MTTRADAGRRRHVIFYEPGRVLIDRQTLAHLTGRSVHTIRARCAIVGHRDGKAVYDMEAAAAVLDGLSTRRRVTAVDQMA